MSDSFPALPGTVNNRVSCAGEDKASEAGEKEGKEEKKSQKLVKKRNKNKAGLNQHATACHVNGTMMGAD